MTTNYNLVLVEWVDSSMSRGWQDISTIESIDEPMYCRSVGWLFCESENCVVIVPHLAGSKDGQTLHQGCGDFAIPKKAVIKMTVLADPADVQMTSVVMKG